MAVSATDVQKAYLAYFGRPADPVGLAYWQTSDAATMKAGFAASTEYSALYSGLNTTQRVSQVYTNLLGRAADATGLVYWATELAAGRQTIATLVDSMMTNALGDDITTIANRVTYATAFSAALDTSAEIVGYSGDTAAAAARTAIASVTTTASLTTAQAALSTTVATVVASGSSSSGTTYTLTTAVDTLTGGSGNDTFNAYIDAAAATDTLTAADVLDGGAGTDTLTITTDGNAAGALPAATMSNIETFSIREVGGTAGVYDFGTVAGETSVINRISTDDMTFSNLAAGATLTIKGDASTTNGATTFTMASATAAVALTIDGGTTAGNIARNQTGAATVTINSTGAANTVGTIDLDTAALMTGLTINATTNLTGSLVAADYAAASTLTATGAGNVDLTGAALSTNITTVTASAMTGGLGVDLGANTTSFVGGSGNDTVFVDNLVIGSTKTVAAGSGSADILRLTDAAALTTTTAQYITGFEVLRLADDNDAAVDSFDMSQLSGLTSLQLDADSAGDGYTLTNMSAAQAAAVTVRGTQNVTPTFGVTGATTVNQIDTLGLTIDDGATTTSTITMANITAAGVENITVAMNDHLTLSALTGATAMTGMTFSTTAKNLSVTAGALALNVNTSVDASAVTGTVTLDFSSATTNGASLKGSASGANILKGGVGADVITGGTGIDTVTNALTGADTLDFVSDSSADIFEIAAITSGKTTIANFDAATTATTEDLVNVSHNSVDGAETAISAAAAQGAIASDTTYVITQTMGTAAALTTAGTATLAAADYTAGTLTNVATYLSERFTGDNDTNADEFAMIFLNNGTTTYAYSYSDSTVANTTIDAGELALIGVFTGAILNAGDIYQTV